MNVPRPPIVAVLGHVDHGKTSLLDNIRKTNVAAKEVGGITQSIGAYTVRVQGTGDSEQSKKEFSELKPKPYSLITFIDTPGHQAFSKMRARGASAADIVILVVAADDGVKPQTRESIAHIKVAEVPFIVVLTKIDLPGADPERAKAELENEGIKLEGRGGDIVVVPVSNKTGEGIDHLLEMVSLVAELHNISGDAEAKLSGVIIESSLDARRGPLATVVIKNGKIKIGNEIVTTDAKGKVRGLIDENGQNLTEILPGYAAQVLGFETTPSVGEPVSLGTEVTKPSLTGPKVPKVSKAEGDMRTLLIVKADTLGRLESLVLSLPETVNVIYKSAGEVTASDVSLASSLGGQILSYGAKVGSDVAKLAQEEKVRISTFNLIYEAITWATKASEAAPVAEKRILGKAEIIAEFPYGEDSRIAGAKVTEGRITKKDRLAVIRKGENLGNVRITSMKQQRREIDKAEKGEEFGIIFAAKFDFRVGDVVESAAHG
ncbi:GTP-binding protein [Candidatus Microgenomates bacterium]|nr:GTP-binding protein [Candidatus Microgenomates bacterium]